jgi:hypothetical protein
MSAERATADVSAAEFLRALFEPMTSGHVNRFSIDRADGSRDVEWSDVNSLDELAARAVALSTSDVWFGMASHAQPLGARRGSADDCEAISALWLDIDIAGPNHAASDLPPSLLDGYKLLASFPVTPSIIVQTGGGAQPYWLLDRPLLAVDAVPFLTRWGQTWAAIGARFGWHVDNVFDITRVMRMPGTFNRKSEPAQPVVITRFDTTLRYSLDAFIPHLITVAPIERSAQHLRLVPLLGNERPGDLFNAETSIVSLLVNYGFVFDHTTVVDGADHFRAPHRHDQRGSTGATVYADGHVQIWSETFAHAHGLVHHRPYDAFGLYTHVEHAGDFVAASAAAAAAQNALRRHQIDSEPFDELSTHIDSSEGAFVDWVRFFANEQTETNWLAEPLLAAGRGHALYAPGGTGKSLLALWLAVQLATGGIGLDGQRLVRRRVMYLDYEMTADDLRERLEAMGIDADSALDYLHYALLPNLPPADSAEGGKAIVELARSVDAEIVFVDTFARAVTGAENDADTVRAWYRWTGMHLKAEGRAFLRVDHAGKDVTKGQRGSSAKADDVDVVWSMIVADGGFTLTAMKRRMSWVPEIVALRQRDEPVLTFSTALQPVLAGTIALAERLDALGVVEDAGRPACRAALKLVGETARNDVLSSAIKLRKARGQRVGQLILPSSQTASGTAGTVGNHTRSDTWDSLGDSSGQSTDANGLSPVYLYTGQPSVTHHEDDDTGDLI